MQNDMIGQLVQYVFKGSVVFFGIAEYITKDGFVGIRQPHEGNRLDEAPISLVQFDFT